MRSLAWALLVCAGLPPSPVLSADKHVIDVSTGDQLIDVLKEPLDGTTVRLAPGTYVLPGTQSSYTQQVRDDVIEINKVKAGVVVSGRGVQLAGAAGGPVEIITDADVGILFSGCRDCAMERIALRGINNDSVILVVSDGGSVRVSDCVLRSEASDPRWARGFLSTNGSDVTIERSEVTRVSSGIRVAPRSSAEIVHTLVNSETANPGGPALLLDDGSRATLRKSHLTGFIDGVHVSSGASLICEVSIIENMSQDGLIAPGRGIGRLRVERSVFYQCGWAGIAVCTDGDQKATGNLVVATGLSQPRESAIYVLAAHADAAVRKNTLYDNTVLDESLDRDVPREIFWRVRRPWTRTYRNTPVGVDGRHRFYESAFLTRYGRWSN